MYENDWTKKWCYAYERVRSDQLKYSLSWWISIYISFFWIPDKETCSSISRPWRIWVKNYTKNAPTTIVIITSLFECDIATTTLISTFVSNIFIIIYVDKSSHYQFFIIFFKKKKIKIIIKYDKTSPKFFHNYTHMHASLQSSPLFIYLSLLPICLSWIK